MPYIQDFPVPQGATLDVDFQIVPPGDVTLAGGRVLWGAWEQSFGVPITADPSGTPLGPVISKDSQTGGIDIFESPESFTVHLTDADTALLPLGNFYHEAHVTDANGNDTPVTQGTMTVTLSLIQGGSTPPTSPSAYTASAVHFAGNTSLSNSALVSTDNAYWSFSFWFKSENLGSTPTVFVVDPTGNYGTVANFFPSPGDGSFQSRVSNADDSQTAQFKSAANILPDTASWHHFIGAHRTSDTVAVGEPQFVACYMDDVQLSNASLSTYNAFVAASNGLSLIIGGDTFGGDNLAGDLADLRIMPGINLLDSTGMAIPEATRRLFIDANGKPVDPAIATAALGAPCVLFSGNAANFVVNQGTGGPFTLVGNPLTDASTHP